MATSFPTRTADAPFPSAPESWYGVMHIFQETDTCPYGHLPALTIADAEYYFKAA